MRRKRLLLEDTSQRAVICAISQPLRPSGFGCAPDGLNLCKVEKSEVAASTSVQKWATFLFQAPSLHRPLSPAFAM
jgi:hypothetical protein